MSQGLSEKLRLLWHYVQARRNFRRWQDREKLHLWQDAQVERHLQRILPRSAYYRDLCRAGAGKNWRQLPASNKASLMAHFDDWNTAGIQMSEAWEIAERAERTRDFHPTLNGITVGLSSGTSGSRGIFLASASERSRWAGTLLARVLQGTLHRAHRAALFLRADSNLYQTVGSRRFQFSFFDLLHPLEDQWKALQKLRPTLLAAPPAALTRMATFPGAAALLEPPALLLSVADVLDDADRAVIEKGFGTRVGQIYQATEGFLAATCPHGNLHWNEDALVVEKDWLDAAHTRYRPIITDFRRTTQPILRYQLDDVIVHSDVPHCPCGSIFGLLGKIEGRQDDVLYLRSLDGQRWITLFPDFVRRAIVLATKTGVDYRVQQGSADQWRLSFSDEHMDPTSLRMEIRRLCAIYSARPPELIFEVWTPPALQVKQRRIRRLMAQPDLS